MQLLETLPDYPIYHIMSDQPDCCGKCGSRLDLMGIKEIGGEQVFINECMGCHREVLIVED